MNQTNIIRTAIGVLCVLILLLVAVIALVLDSQSPDPVLGIFQTVPSSTQPDPTDTTAPDEVVNTQPEETRDTTVSATEDTQQPSEQPVTDPAAPTEPTSQPVTDPAVPTEPTTQPVTDPAVPTEPTTQPVTDPAVPTEPTTQPVTDPAVPTQPTTQPVTDPAVPTQPTTQPVTDPAAPTQPTTVPTEPTEPEQPTAGVTDEELTEPDDPSGSVTLPTEADPETGEPAGISFPCQVPDYDLTIEKLAPYSGMFVEDGSNGYVDNVAMLLIHNHGALPIEYTQICVQYEDETLIFDISALPAGEKIVVQEKTGKAIPEGIPQAANAMVVRRADMDMSLDKVLVTDNGDNTLTIQNLTSETIPTVRIFYKHYMEDEGIFVGGIAFTVRITRLTAGSSITIQPAHYTSQTSRVVMVLTYDTEV